MDIATLKDILNLGWPAIVTVAFYLLARQYMAGVESEITYLRAKVDMLEADLMQVKTKLIGEHLMGDK
jgi:hypothetical protein